MPGKSDRDRAVPRGARDSARQDRGSARRARRSGPETPLTRERIVRTALAIVDRHGLERDFEFGVRALARGLLEGAGSGD